MSDTDRLVAAMRLNRVAGLRHDALFEALRHLAVGMNAVALGVPIQVLVDGRLIRGRTAAEFESAQRLDRSMSELLRGSDESNFLAELFDDEAGVFVSWVNHLRERAAAADDLLETLQEGADGDLTRLPSDAAVDYLLAHRPATALMLVEAEIFESGTWQKLGDFRISIDRIGGWWLLTPDSATASGGPKTAEL